VPELLTMAECEVLILGHTHIPFVKDSGKGAIVNPGSVGQPRDGDPRAAFMLMDLETGELDLVREEYDVATVISTLEGECLPADLGKKLLQGL
jgi:predicted phosphodiesterase